MTPRSFSPSRLIHALAAFLLAASAVTAPAAVLNAAFSAATDVPVTASSYTASGDTVNISLNFAPTAGTTLTVVKNTGLSFITGQFGNLAQGQKVTLSHNGSAYNFTANYFGGTGNDLVLHWSGLTAQIWGSHSSYPQAAMPPFVKVAAGYFHTVALGGDGTVAAWGDNSRGQTNVPTGLSGVTAIAAGWWHTVTLKSDGTVVAWGDNGYGQRTVPAGLSGVAAIAAGGFHTVALKRDGTLVAWGDNFDGQATVPAGLTGVVAIAAGGSHTVALKRDGTVVAWGDNYYSQTNVPAGLSGVAAIAAGGSHTVALKINSTMVAWGDNRRGQTNVPVSLSGVAAIAADWRHTVALMGDGTVVAWGDNSRGQTNVPAGLSGVAAIAAGGEHNVALVPQRPSLARTSTDGITSTGATLRGQVNPNWQPATAQFEYGTTASFGSTASLTLSPADGSSDQSVSATISGLTPDTLYYYRLAATNAAGTASSTGAFATGSLTATYNAGTDVPVTAGGFTASGSTVNFTLNFAPTPGTTLTVIKNTGLSFIAGAFSNLAQGQIVTLSHNGSTYNFTADYFGGTGNDLVLQWSGLTAHVWGSHDSYPQDQIPPFVEVAAGAGHTVALKSDGTVVAWGDNFHGQTTVPAGPKWSGGHRSGL